MPFTCPACGYTGMDHIILGQLGLLLHIRCRSCGIDFHRDLRY